MSVLIKGMKMPKNCMECPFSDHEAWCLIPGDPKLRYYYPEKEISEHCPLVEVPEPHGRLIDADATMKQWGFNNATKYGNKTAEQQHFSYSTMMMYEFANILDDAPVVIEVEDE